MSTTKPKLSPKAETVLVALMQHPTIAGAAKACELSEQTVWRLLQTPEFSQAYAQARRQAFDQALSFLQKASSGAVATLIQVMQDKTAAPSAKVAAARSVLEYSFRASEQMDLEERLTAIEEALQGTEAQR